MFDNEENNGIFNGANGVGDTPDEAAEEARVEEATATTGAQPIPAMPNQNVAATNQNVQVTAQGPAWLAPILGVGLLGMGIVAMAIPVALGAAGAALAAPKGQRKERMLGGALVGLGASMAAGMLDSQGRIPMFRSIAAFGGGYTYAFKRIRGEWPTPTAIKEAHTAPALPAPR
jgi:hypothetical protein